MNRSLNDSDYGCAPASSNNPFDSTHMANHQTLGGFTHKAPLLSTDMRCYFGCNQGFKKDWDLRMHLKLRHKNEDEKELERAYQDAEDEISLTKRSMSIYQCALCPKQYSGMTSFFGHIQKVHDRKWLDYKSQYGPCEVERGPFQCHICDRVMKYDRNNVDRHLKGVHKITWPTYLDRIRKLRRGEKLDDLPTIQMFECKICNSSVKDFSRHLERNHSITEREYADLVTDEVVKNPSNAGKTEVTRNSTYAYSNLASGTSSNQDAENTNTLVHSSNLNFAHENNPVKLEKQFHPSKMEIKDKTNKSCSPCDTEFDSRRFFIEHCTTVHNMKFKTTSGVTIAAPTPQSPVENQNFSPMCVVKQAYSVPNQEKFVSHVSPHTPAYNAYPNQKRSRNKEDFGPEESMNIGNETRYGRKIKRTSM